MLENARNAHLFLFLLSETGAFASGVNGRTLSDSCCQTDASRKKCSRQKALFSKPCFNPDPRYAQEVNKHGGGGAGLNTPVCCNCANYPLCIDIHIMVVNKIIFIKQSLNSRLNTEWLN